MKPENKFLFEQIKNLIKDHLNDYDISDQEFDKYYQLNGGHAKINSIVNNIKESIEVRTKIIQK
jgi:hypothetical protein